MAEERRLVEEEGSYSKKTWLQKMEDRVSSYLGPAFLFSHFSFLFFYLLYLAAYQIAMNYHTDSQSLQLEITADWKSRNWI